MSLPGAWIVMVAGALWPAPRLGVQGAWLAALACIALASGLYTWRLASGRWRWARL